ncbi:MAG: heme transporter HemC, partial [Methylocystis sp.]|nr:heme transporter HemC [Methylocystis sp.]
MNAVLAYANPTLFLALTRRVLPWLTAAATLLLAAGLYLVFFVVPPDYQQGETVKIMYVHAPSAWLAIFAYMVMTSA